MTDNEPGIVTMPLDQEGHYLTRLSTVSVLNYFTPIHYQVVIEGPFQCQMCAEYVSLRVGEQTVRAETPCHSPDGLTVVTEFVVHSGQVIVTDDLRPAFDVDDREMPSYNTVLGQAAYVRAMAEIGCAYGPVLNTCPGLYRQADESYIIANPGYDDDGETYGLDDAEELAGICTDLWAYSLADLQDWIDRGGRVEEMKSTATIVPMPIGIYEVTLHTGERDFDYHAEGPVVFAEITRVKDLS